MKFTQYLYPDGRREHREFKASEATEKLATELQDAGWHFECECNPRTSIVLVDCCDHEEQLAQEAELNGPDVPAAVERLVTTAHARWLERGKPEGQGKRALIADARAFQAWDYQQRL